MFAINPDAEVTQVDVWNLYKDAFQPYQDSYPLLAAPDVVKNFSNVYAVAQPMVLSGPPVKFIIRGVDRRKDISAADRLKCQWDRSECSAPPFSTPAELCEHVLQHVDSSIAEDEATCLWSYCPKGNIHKDNFRSHVLTHFWSAHIPERHPSQSDTITLSHPAAVYPVQNPTRRNPPLPRSTMINFQRTVGDAPSTSLLALLCIRILWRTSFASVETAPKVDADHFGFPGVTEEVEEEDGMQAEGGVLDEEKEGGRKGRKTFGDVRKLLEAVQIKDEILMGWIIEMINTGMEG